jgi:hypothetical protein
VISFDVIVTTCERPCHEPRVNLRLSNSCMGGDLVTMCTCYWNHDVGCLAEIEAQSQTRLEARRLHE